MSTTPIFIHSRLDDLGLRPSEFRVYARVARRAGDKGVCNESEAKIAKGCRINQKTASDCLEKLTEKGLLKCRRRTGKTNEYRLAPMNQWKVAPHPKEYPTQKNTQVSERVHTAPNGIPNHPTQLNTHKGNPFEGNPSKEIPEHKRI
jgi:hypothetical protein